MRAQGRLDNGVACSDEIKTRGHHVPARVQARLIESFEKYDIAHAPLRIADLGQTDFLLLIDVRRFRITVDGTVGEDRRQERQSRRGAAV
jgi:hypothetical protein